MSERENILKILIKWDKTSFYIDYLLSNNKTSNFSYRIIKGVIENKLFLEYIIDDYLNRNVSNSIYWILKIAFYELLFNNSSKNYATVNEAVELAKKYNKNSKNLVNAVLRNFLRDDKKYKLPKSKVKQISVKYSFPVWLVQLFLKNYNNNLKMVEDLFEYFNNNSYIDLRVNKTKINKKEYKKYLEKEGIAYKDFNINDFHIRILDSIEVSSLMGYSEGYFYIQDLSAQIIGSLIYPIEGKVLDIGSAPGGKLTLFTLLNKNNFDITAIEKSKKRLKRLKKNLKYYNSKNINIKNVDILNFDTKKKFKHIFIDAPCSGLGTLSKNIDIKYRLKKNDIKSLSKIQYKILNKAKQFLKSDCELIYSTCTINNRENHAIIEKFLKNNKKYFIFDIKEKKYLHKKIINGILNKQKELNVYPPRDLMDGMYAVVLKKKE